MRMPRVRLTTQWLMVLMAFVAILICGAIEVVPDLCRRWTACRDAERACLAQASYFAKGPEDYWDSEAAAKSRHRRKAAFYLKWSRTFRHALYFPWELYRKDLEMSLVSQEALNLDSQAP